MNEESMSTLEQGAYRFEVIDNRADWSSVLTEFPAYDFYHTYDYHRLNYDDKSDQALLFCFEQDGVSIALPLIRRKIDGVNFDAVSVYGYSGLLVDRPDALTDSIRNNFSSALTAESKRLRLVSVFARMHPLIDDCGLLDGLGLQEHCGDTVSIDLSLSEEDQFSQFSSNHRRGIRKLAKVGVSCEISQAKEDLDAFIEIYQQSMDRVGATQAYFFSRAYFDKLLSSAEIPMELFVCRHEAQVICGGLFSSCNGIIQYHLGGTRSDFLRLAPTKLMFNTVGLWGAGNGDASFHLGGGVGGKDDGLFSFKRGVSETTTPFNVWKWIVDAEQYDRLSCDYDDGPKTDAARYEGFFPLYRRPTGD